MNKPRLTDAQREEVRQAVIDYGLDFSRVPCWSFSTPESLLVADKNGDIETPEGSFAISEDFLARAMSFEPPRSQRPAFERRPRVRAARVRAVRELRSTAPDGRTVVAVLLKDGTCGLMWAPGPGRDLAAPGENTIVLEGSPISDNIFSFLCSLNGVDEGLARHCQDQINLLRG
jgi:hypothetical protein